jgi:hypothetical protein
MSQKTMLLLTVFSVLVAVAFFWRKHTRSQPPAIAHRPSEAASGATASAAPILHAEPNLSPTGAPVGQNEREASARFREWAASDPSAAMAWALKISDPGKRAEILQQLCSVIAEDDPAEALKMARTLKLSEPVLESIIEPWAQDDIAAALAWTFSQPPGDERDQLMRRVVSVLAQADPADAADLVFEKIPPGVMRDAAVVTVVDQWGSQDFQAAASWVSSFPQGPLKQRASAELNDLLRYRNSLAH